MLWSCSPVPEGAAKLKNRDNPEGARKYSIVTYLVLLFAVVIALVLLSYFVQEKRDSSDMNAFRQQHLSRLEQIELRVAETEDALAALEERLAAAEERQDTLDAEISELQKAESADRADISALKEEQTALRGEIKTIREVLNEQMEENGN